MAPVSNHSSAMIYSGLSLHRRAGAAAGVSTGGRTDRVSGTGLRTRLPGERSARGRACVAPAPAPSAGGLRFAQLPKQRGILPNAVKPTVGQHVPRQEAVVDGERASVYIANGIDQ